MILVTGASGNAGGAVLRSAMDLRLPLRAMYRNDADARAAPPGAPAVVADFADKPSLLRALDGVDVVYLVCGPIPQLVELEAAAIAACREAGVRHIVLNSALGAGHFPKSFPSWHAQVEERLAQSGLDHTILRPNGFMQNIATYSAATIAADRAFYAAMGEAKTSLVDVRDVGDVVAKIAAEPHRHAGRTYELNGPEAVSNAEIAERLSRILGHEVRFIDIPEEAQRQSMLALGMPGWQVSAILELQEYYRSGSCAAVDGTIAEILGRPPRRLDAYLSEYADTFRGRAS